MSVSAMVEVTSVFVKKNGTSCGQCQKKTDLPTEIMLFYYRGSKKLKRCGKIQVKARYCSDCDTWSMHDSLFQQYNLYVPKQCRLLIRKKTVYVPIKSGIPKMARGFNKYGQFKPSDN